MKKISLPKGITIDTFEQTPVNFNPIHADQETLARYGHPRRPENPEMLQHWKKLFGKPLQTIEPSFRVMENVRHGPRLKAAVEETTTSNNWSGTVAYTSTNSKFVSVNGQWTAPNPNPGHVMGVTEYYSSSWIGIDGDGGSPDVFQAGIECDATITDGNIQRTIYAWSEWYPDYSVQINNFPVSAGDVLTCHLSVVPFSNNSGLVVLRNETQGISTSFQINAPTGTTLAGNCAEWIVERPEVNGAITNLTDYGVVNFHDSYGDTSNAVINAGAGSAINMINNNGNVISTATSNGMDITCTYTG